MEIEVGEYVRLARNQGINKIIDEDDDGFLVLDVTIADEFGDECFEISLQDVDKEILKHSFNIIDLIEVGDYVNGYKIIAKSDDGYIEILTEDIDQGELLEEQDIKTILTKEQYMQNCYKIPEKSSGNN